MSNGKTIKMNTEVHLDREALNSVCPFYFEFDESFIIIDAGTSILKICPNLIGTVIGNKIRLNGPKNLSQEYKAWRSHLRKIISFSYVHDDVNVIFKGQLVPLRKNSSLLFFGVPMIIKPEMISNLGLNLSDFSVSDSTNELIHFLDVNKASRMDLNKLVKELKDQEKKYRNLVENASEIILSTDKDGNIDYINEVGAKLFQINPHEKAINFISLIAKDYQKKIYNECKELVLFGDKKQHKIYVEFPLKGTENGNTIWIGQNITTLYENNNLIGFQAVGRDITRNIRLHRQAIAQKEKATALAKAKSRFLANMSHEIRTPLNGIIGLTNLMLNSKLTKTQKKYLNAINSSSETLMVVINDILDLAKIEAGKLTIKKDPVDLRILIGQLCEMMSSKAVEKNIQLEYSIDDQVPPIIFADPARLNQILFNLVGNAIKFTLQGFVKINVKVVKIIKDCCTLHFEIEDTGIGIPKEKIGQIFRAFQQAENNESRTFTGTGLGLTISKRIIELYHGELDVQSEMGKGSKFSFAIKFDYTTTNRIKKTQKNTDFTGHDITVLLVEDNTINQMVTVNLLEEKKITVDVAENGLEAIQLLDKRNYDLILMDMQMPIMDGYTAINKIRKSAKKYANIPIISLTAHVSEIEIKKCKELGANGYISKPFKPEELYSEIMNLTLNKKK